MMIHTICIVELDNCNILLCEPFTSREGTLEAADAFLRAYEADNDYRENELVNELIDDPDAGVIFTNNAIQISVFSKDLL